MGTKLHLCILLAGSVLAKAPELPLCPANFQYLPQSLPMHCRMPVNGHPPPFPVLPGAPGKPQENTQTVPVPPMPAFPKPSEFPPGSFPGFPAGFPMQPGMGMPPMGMPMQMAGPPQGKLPVIVMPFYSPDPNFKGPAPNLRPGYENHRQHKKKRERKRKRRPQKSDDSSSDTDTDNSGEEDKEVDDGFWQSGRRTMNALRGRRHKPHRRKEFLTPILQYVTKDGYVIYEKQISKEEAKDWLGKGKANDEEKPSQEPEATPKSVEEDDSTPAEVSTRAAAPRPPQKMQVKIKKVTDTQRHHRLKPRRQPLTENE